jgi:hypothetical protein
MLGEVLIASSNSVSASFSAPRAAVQVRNHETDDTTKNGSNSDEQYHDSS